MTETQKENEQRIFDAITYLKDSIFGLRQSITPYCFDFSQKTGYSLNHNKSVVFIKNLTDSCAETTEYISEYDEIIPLFFDVCILFLFAACNPEDWSFASIKVLSTTVNKHGTPDTCKWSSCPASRAVMPGQSGP